MTSRQSRMRARQKEAGLKRFDLMLSADAVKNLDELARIFEGDTISELIEDALENRLTQYHEAMT